MKSQVNRQPEVAPKVASHAPSRGASGFVRELAMLFKLRLSLLVVFSTGMAYFISLSSSVVWFDFTILLLSGFLITGSANAINQVLEKDYDALMSRTKDRPVAAGRMSTSAAVLIAGVSVAIGLTLLATLNWLAALLGAMAFMSYAFIYTPLKRFTPLATWVGAFPGALPVVIGSVVAAGSLTPLALVLFSIQFLWQFPHFWAIAWLMQEDYAKAGFFLLPGRNQQKDKIVGLNSLIYAGAIAPVVIASWNYGIFGTWGLVLLGLTLSFYLYKSFLLFLRNDDESARQLMFASFYFLPLALVAFFL